MHLLVAVFVDSRRRDVDSKRHWRLDVKPLWKVILAVPAFLVIPGTAVAGPEPVSPSPAPAIPVITAAFAEHPVVAIAESHAIRQAGDFYVALVRDPAFQRSVNDIVAEFASGQSQPLLDRYVLEGQPLEPGELSSIWRDTTKVASWESPIYGRWLAAIRDVNRSLAPDRRLRVLARDTAIDWSHVRSHADWAELGDNNRTFARVIEENVLARGRKALVVLGSNHLTRGGDRDGGPNTTTLVETRHPTSMFIVFLYTGRPGGEIADARFTQDGWQAPAVVRLRGAWPGAIEAGSRRLENLAHALLFLGTSQALATEEAPVSAFDPAYLSELDRRSAIEWGDPTKARRFLGVSAKP